MCGAGQDFLSLDGTVPIQKELVDRKHPRLCASTARGDLDDLHGRVRKSGPEGDRTHDLVHAMHALSQLSYRPDR